MHLNVTIKNVSWPHFSWTTLYILLLMRLICWGAPLRCTVVRCAWLFVVSCAGGWDGERVIVTNGIGVAAFWVWSIKISHYLHFQPSLSVLEHEVLIDTMIFNLPVFIATKVPHQISLSQRSVVGYLLALGTSRDGQRHQADRHSIERIISCFENETQTFLIMLLIIFETIESYGAHLVTFPVLLT